MLEVRGLRKTYGDLVAVHDVSFAVGAGEVLGLLGPNGAGKSTTVAMIAGLVTPAAGQVLIHGAPLTGDTDDKVSLRNTRNLTQKLQGLGVAVDKVLFPGVGHARTVVSFAKLFRDGVPVLDEAARFIDAH